jgi:hypothetical protein
MEFRARMLRGRAAGEPRPAVRHNAVVATLTGIAGGLAMALPVVIYDWATGAHSALELPMAATAWVFGLGHFTQNGYEWWPIVVGILLLTAYAIVHGAVFGGFADRFLRLRTLPEVMGVGAAWGFVSWLFFWYTLLPIARGGAPFVAEASGLLVAPVWVFVIAFAVLGVASALAFVAAERR